MAPESSDGRARRGYLILAGILIAAVVIFNVDAVKDMTGDRLDLVALLPDASGVRVGTPVWVAGVKAGRVIAIVFRPAGDSAEVALTLRVAEPAAAVIRLDSDVRAVRTRIVGQPVVQLEAGSAAAPPARPGDTLRAYPRVDPALLLERGKALPGAVDTLLTTARRVAELVRARAPEMERLQDRIDAAMAAADALSAVLQEGSLARLMSADGAPAAVPTLRARLDTLAAETAYVLGRYAGEDGDLRRELRQLAAGAAALQEDLDTLTARLNGGRGFLGRMPRDSAIQVAIRGVRAQIDTLRQEAASIALRMVVP